MFGNAAGTVTQGNDARLSDARTPTTHTHAQSDVTGLSTALSGKVGTDGTVLSIVKLTQAAYDALGSGRPSTTLYVIVG
ncbi:phage upper tail fiber protein [Nocardia grenadensis]|uniref:phage upper tail fiber protein n=1 Tax=Nocardia grenadensis TaxID=931537 RepID=UPI003D764AB6